MNSGIENINECMILKINEEFNEEKNEYAVSWREIR